MAFTSMQFVMFLVLAVAVYYLTPKRYRWVTLLVVNYVFYYFAGVSNTLYTCLPQPSAHTSQQRN